MKKVISAVKVRVVKHLEFPGLGEKIKAARNDSGCTVKYLCEQLGVSRTYWYDIENETLSGALSIENLRKIEQLLDTDLGVEV